MGLFDKKEKSNEEEVQVVAKTPEEMRKEENRSKGSSFVMGIEGVISSEEDDRVRLIGKMDGCAILEGKAFVCNPGSDNDTIGEVTIQAIWENNEEVMATSGGAVMLTVPKIENRTFRVGDVLYTEDVTVESKVHSYVKALTNTYVAGKHLSLKKEEVDRLSITDVEELWRFYGWFIREIEKDDSEEKKAEQEAKISLVCETLCSKILAADYIYAVYSTQTGEPYLFSKTIAREEGGFMCTTPTIRIFTESYKERLAEQYNEEKFEIKKIENGEDKKGIFNFFGTAFYLDGAAAVEVISEDTALGAGALVNRAEFVKAPADYAAVTNPELVRWMLLLGQFVKEDMEKDENRLILNIYYRFLAYAMMQARFLIPMHSAKGMSPLGEKGRLTITAEDAVALPVLPGKDGRQAIRMFTDWRYLYSEFDVGLGAAVETLDSDISKFDCAINFAKYPKAAQYVTLSDYRRFEELAQKLSGEKK